MIFFFRILRVQSSWAGAGKLAGLDCILLKLGGNSSLTNVPLPYGKLQAAKQLGSASAKLQVQIQVSHSGPNWGCAGQGRVF